MSLKLNLRAQKLNIINILKLELAKDNTSASTNF